MKYGQPRGPWIDAASAKTALPGSAGDVVNTPPQLATVAQLISIHTWANAFLRKGYDAAGLNRDHSTLRVCNKVAFADIRGLLRSREVPLAADPLTWLKWLRDEGCQAVRIRHFPRPDSRPPDKDQDAKSEEEPGWVLECEREGAVDRWRCRWQLTNRYAPQGRNWSVIYTRQERKLELIRLTAPDLPALGEQLLSTLQDCERCAQKLAQTAWAECLARAQAVLDSEKPFEGSAHPDLLPRVGGSLPARQMLAACCMALGCELGPSSVPANVDAEEASLELGSKQAALQTTLTQCAEHATNLWAESS